VCKVISDANKGIDGIIFNLDPLGCEYVIQYSDDEGWFKKKYSRFHHRIRIEEEVASVGILLI
jgi:hypothetical protein